MQNERQLSMFEQVNLGILAALLLFCARTCERINTWREERRLDANFALQIEVLQHPVAFAQEEDNWRLYTPFVDQMLRDGAYRILATGQRTDGDGEITTSTAVIPTDVSKYPAEKKPIWIIFDKNGCFKDLNGGLGIASVYYAFVPTDLERFRDKPDRRRGQEVPSGGEILYKDTDIALRQMTWYEHNGSQYLVTRCDKGETFVPVQASFLDWLRMVQQAAEKQ